MKLAKRMSRLGTETAFDVLVKAKALEAQGKDVVHLEIGEPDFDTPKNIRDAGCEAINSGYTHYGPAAGLPQFREAIAKYISETRDIDVSIDEIVVTPGAKPIMFFGILACVDEGTEVIYPNPGFPIYESVINFVGAKPVPVPLREEVDFRFDLDALKDSVSDKTSMIVINSPQNPTGGVLLKSDMEVIAELAMKHDAIVLSDEVYSQMLYDDAKHESITSIPGMKERTIMIEGHSKTYAMTGWRLGYGVMPSDMAEQIAKLMVNSNSCTAAMVQMAGLEALTGPQDEVARMVAELKTRRDAIVSGLNSIEGITCKNPLGAFYVFPNVTAMPMNSDDFAEYLLQEYAVATLSGTAFGEYGDGYLRLSYAGSLDSIKEGLKRINEAVKNLK
ncbi:aminotransferase class I/II-fold pyridoxal phosphate-dependent enzyme [Candidatus Poribacteria bacterium]|nr:aminotransferase class I/II-fold pyridoxal phosphate-dependent enzyme [Candidatus Poribacteria bacterium]